MIYRSTTNTRGLTTERSELAAWISSAGEQTWVGERLSEYRGAVLRV
jgi:hypothetical protein